MPNTITSQHTYTFWPTGESVTVYISNTEEKFAIGLSFNHKGIDKEIKWTSCYQGILQIQSKINPKIWYIYLSAYWDGGEKDVTTERVMMVSDCNANLLAESHKD